MDYRLNFSFPFKFRFYEPGNMKVQLWPAGGGMLRLQIVNQDLIARKGQGKKFRKV